MWKPLLLASRFIDNPQAICSVIPTSRWGVQKVRRHIRTDLQRTIVELGPGPWPAVRPEQLTEDSRLILIERDRVLASALQQIDDRRVRVFHADAMDMGDILKSCGVNHVDHVLSSLPHTLNRAWSEELIERCAPYILESMIVFIFRDIRTHLMKSFGHVHREREWLNLLPLLVHVASHAGDHVRTRIKPEAQSHPTPPQTSVSPAP